MATPSIKEEARRLVEKLPENSHGKTSYTKFTSVKLLRQDWLTAKRDERPMSNKCAPRSDCRREGSLDRYRTKPSAKHSYLHRAELTRVRPENR